VSATMLTARQVQDLLDVDASTIYRMAGDGRLPAVRVGRQWRFPAAAIDRLLVAPLGVVVGEEPKARTLPSSLAVATLEAVAPALGVSMVVTDLSGRAITPIVHPAPFIADRLDDAGFSADCAREWAAFAAEPHLSPRLRLGGHGFLCAHSFVRDGSSLIAMVLAGGIAPDGDDAATSTLFHLDAAARARVIDTLPRVAALLSALVTDDVTAAGAIR
jgi:excisionase family DNA binding protein